MTLPARRVFKHVTPLGGGLFAAVHRRTGNVVIYKGGRVISDVIELDRLGEGATAALADFLKQSHGPEGDEDGVLAS